jgi:Na+/H+ antiporter NhaD/arsenite permease-like protein
MVALCVFSRLIPILLENMAVVLLMGPIALATARMCEISRTPLLTGIAVRLNLQTNGIPSIGLLFSIVSALASTLFAPS